MADNVVTQTHSISGDLDKSLTLHINEFMASNDYAIQDEMGNYDDWIELYNPNDFAIDLAGMHLTDDLSVPMKWQFPSDSPVETTIPGHGYLLLWADEEPDEGTLHTNFKLDKSGEEIGLFNSNGSNLIDSVVYNEQLPDVSYGHSPDGSDTWRYFDTHSPLSANGTGYLGQVSETLFSVERGIYDYAFDLTITCSMPETAINYTTNGNEPTAHSTLYTGPIHIDETTCIRAAAFRNGWLRSRVATHSYFFNLTNTRTSLPIISIVGDEEESLYAPNGVTAFPRMRGIEYERPVSLEWIYPEDNSGYQVNCGIRVQGSDYHRARYTIGNGDNWTTNYDKYSFKFYFRDRYDGSDQLEFPMFPRSDISSYHSFTLRGGHNDRNPFIKDELLRRLHKDMGRTEELSGTFTNVFINGEYKHYYNPCERTDEEYLQEYCDSNYDWDIMKITAYVGGAYILPIRSGDDIAWNAMIDYIHSHDLADDSKYQELGQAHLDIPCFVDYLVLQLYSGNWDWPSNNWVASRERSEQGLYRFYAWDTEAAFGDITKVAFNVYPGWAEDLGLNGNDTPIAWLYRALAVNSNFRQLMCDRLYKHFYNDGALTETKIADHFWELHTIISQVNSGMSTSIASFWIPGRFDILKDAFTAQGMFTFEGPVFNINGVYQHGGYVEPNSELTMIMTSSNEYVNMTLLDEEHPVRVHVPADNSLGTTWTTADFIPNPATWSNGTTHTGIGYERSRGYEHLIETDVESDMYAKEKSVLCRLAFDYDGQAFEALLLYMKYDDGFVAYLNGANEIARSPNVTHDTPGSAATGNHEAGSSYEAFPIPDYQSLLVVGTNVLAIHGINGSLTSSDMLVLPMIVGKVINISQAESFILTESIPVKARTLDNDLWSALSTSIFEMGTKR